MKEVLRGTGSALRFAAMLVLTATTLVITIDVAARYLFSQPVPGVLELVSDFAMPLMVFLTAAHCYESGGLIAIDLLRGRLPTGLARAVNFFAFSISVCVVFVMTFSAARQALRAYTLNSIQMGHFEYPTWPVYTLVFAGLALMAVVMLADVRAARRRDYEMPRATQEEVM